MKKLVVFVLLLACLGATFAFKNEKNPLFQMPAEQVCFVDEKSYSDIFDVETVQCGDLIFNFCSLQDARENLGKIKDFKAIQFYFSSISCEELLKTLKAEILSEESPEGLRIINAYTPYFSKSVLIGNKKVNLQIALREERIVAGFPMLLTGY